MLQNIPKEKILEIVKQGPTLPIRIAKQLNTETVLIGAILSTLIHTGEVKVSSLKIGSSPVYYYKDHEARLEEYVSHLNEKDQRTQSMLKEHKVLKDSEQDPLIRVSLRNIKDFAKSFELESHGIKELFWRYFLVDETEAVPLAKELLKKSAAAVKEDVLEENIIADEHVQEKKVEEKKVVAQTEPRHEVKEKPEIPAKQEPSERESIVKETPLAKEKSREDFFEKVKDFLHHKNLDIINKEKLKKSEYHLVLKDHEKDAYHFCKAKDKKTISDGDLATAFVYAQSKKMSCIFITTGKLSKKAEQMLSKEFAGLVVEYIL